MNKGDKSKEYSELKVRQYDKNNTIEGYGMHRAMQQCNFDGFDIQEAFEEGWDEAMKSQWAKVEDELPKVGVKVLVLTTNKKIAISFRYTPKDIYGKVLGNDEWQGSSALNKCIIAWMPIPSFDKILEDNKDVLKRLKDK